ncbi:hypothetical protein VP01_1022g7 [Puccinia sorghi]|uniref:Uncharacterized protein n=1 Tax=Puccinia sorghi TaxID=27349 RepID=A0A0L6VUV1_9BASI|nr:hypothetical protein VP01_1022g7 [Puccinia sorghi]
MNEASGVELAQDTPYIVLLMSLKNKGKMINSPILPEDNQQILQVLHGLKSFACLTDEVVEALQEMIDVKPDLLLRHDNDVKQYINTSKPLVYTSIQY